MPLIDGVIASASIPCVFPPVLLGAEAYVDGDILLWETSERQLEGARLLAAEQNKSVWVVTPRTSLHDLLTIDPGLIDIHIGYG